MKRSSRNIMTMKAALTLFAFSACLALISGHAYGQGTYTAKDEDGIERDLPNEKDLPFDFLKVNGQPQRCGIPTKKTDATGRVTISCPTGTGGSCKLFYSLKNSNDPRACGKLGHGAPAPGMVDRWRWILNPNNYDKDFTYACFTGVKKDFPDLKHGSYSATDEDGIERYLPDEKDLPFEFVKVNGQPKKCGAMTKNSDATGKVTLSCPAGACAPEYPGSDCKLFYSLKDTTDADALGKLGNGAPPPGSVDIWRWILNPNNYEKDFTYACFCTRPKVVSNKPPCKTEKEAEVIELAAANATLEKSGNIADSLRKIKFPADGAYWFAELYYYITLYEIRDLNRFKHPAFVMHFIPIFYDLYAKNEELFEKGEFGKIAPQWRAHFEPHLVSPLDAKAYRPQAINTVEYTDAATMILVSGVTAHIKGDMSVALEKAYRSYAAKYCDALPFDEYYDDFFKTNKPIFEKVRKALVGEINEHLGIVVDTEAALQVADKVNIGLNIEEVYSWREAAWQKARSNIMKSSSGSPK